MTRVPGLWLMKSEPEKYAFSTLQRDGRTLWDGVRSNQAALYLKAMRIGDRAFFYHSNIGLEIVGIMTIVREAEIDPGDPKGRFVAVEVAPVRALAKPVALAAMKAHPGLAGMTMFRQFRLSVTPLTPDEWAIIEGMGA